MNGEGRSGVSLRGLLEQMCSGGRSGRIELSAGDERLGTVVLRQGRLAWAVCVNQPEDLGTFLHRIGRVTREDLLDVRRRYDELGGRRKLGQLMEEAGILSRPVLRRCLLLHARRALGCLLSRSEAVVDSYSTNMVADEELTFALEEVMPEFERSGSWPRVRAVMQTDGGEVLAPLRDVAGYLASGVFTGDGGIIAADCERSVIDPLVLGVLIASVAESSSRASTTAGMGVTTSMHLECAEGSVIAQWTDEGRETFAAVVLSRDGSPGMAKYKLSGMVGAIAEWVRRRENNGSVPRLSGAGG